MTPSITLMAAGEVRAALEAATRGDAPATVHALLSIDPASWQAIEHRLTVLGTTLPDLIATLREPETT
ncbi:hypothetical protein [Streptomyces sp. NPDC046197]|uniref:hypothetical protein n=1 Tax=Streptomyces sp. NPDC046197 TaxID=3154337 RepID=UPI0033F50DD5